MSKIILDLSFTSKKAFSQENYTIYYTKQEVFNDIAQAKDFLTDMFYHTKTIRPMYTESKGTPDFKSGLIFCYTEKGERSNQIYNIQVWVSVNESTSDKTMQSLNLDTIPDFIKCTRPY